MPATKFTNPEAYLFTLSPEIRERMESVRGTVMELAPQAEEVISYNMPAFRLKEILLWYAAFRKHIGIYPKAATIEAFRNELKGYKTSKGAIQFPHNRPLPLDLIRKLVEYRLQKMRIN